VQPICNAEVGDYCKVNNIPWIPGAMTINEIYFANMIGADVVKVFPANTLGPEYIKALRGPLPFVKLMVTGGIEPNAKDINEWFASGVNACGLGSQLFNSEEKINDLTSILKSLISSLKNR
jgi:2-dehydro-3-deoxyphosphogluconate aldolase/(4S)-4-hydroxy-2-oxoglutarate aldolase